MLSADQGQVLNTQRLSASPTQPSKPFLTSPVYLCCKKAFFQQWHIYSSFTYNPLNLLRAQPEISLES
uniref:Uncharacterized protein n=1 Tax=Anguilla anguilla TaxID=7936 RepID=A0A0E9Q9A5_ANGAN